MCAALFLNFHGSQGLSAPLQRARSPENLQHSGCYHRVDRNMILFTYRHFQRDYSCRVHGTLSVSHWLLWQARAPHRRIAPASASCDANLSVAILSHGTDGCQHITSILLISVYPFMLCIFRARARRIRTLHGRRTELMLRENGASGVGGAAAGIFAGLAGSFVFKRLPRLIHKNSRRTALWPSVCRFSLLFFLMHALRKRESPFVRFALHR